MKERTPHHAHWNQVGQGWQHWDPPLRPCAADLRVMEEWVRKCRPQNARRARALLWGVTPEIAEMAWPEGTELLAVDHSEEMIQFIWPGNIEGKRRAFRGDWLRYSGDAGYDIVIGDGVFAQLRFPEEYRTLAAQSRRMLIDDGIFITRMFVRPLVTESTAAVFDDLRAGRIGNFHVFKFRLAMSLQADAEAAVRMGDVYNAWSEARIDLEELMSSTGWSQESIDTIHHYRGKDSCLSFPTLAEFEAVVSDFFCRLECRIPEYEMGDRCPLLCYQAEA